MKQSHWESERLLRGVAPAKNPLSSKGSTFEFVLHLPTPVALADKSIGFWLVISRESAGADSQ